MERLIYGLTDPATHEVRYVGSSTKGLIRPYEHLRPCAYKTDRRVYRWVREIVDRGLLPEVVVLEHVSDEVDLIATETWWIRYLRCFGCDLTNSTGRAGGTGMTGKQHSEETKQKISSKKRGIKLSEVSRKNIAIASKKRGMPKVAIEAARSVKIGKKRSSETRRKISEAVKKNWEARRGGV